MKDKLRDNHEQLIEKIIGNGIVEGEEMDITTNKILDYIEQNFVEKPKVTNEQAMDFLAKIYGWERNNSSRDKEQQKSTTMSKERAEEILVYNKLKAIKQQYAEEIAYLQPIEFLKIEDLVVVLTMSKPEKDFALIKALLNLLNEIP